MTRQLIEEGRQHLLLGAMIETGCPVRILQGVQDPDVPWQHAVELTSRFARDDVVLTLVKDGALVAAREFAWGYQDDERHLRSRDDVSDRLGAALEEFFGDCGARPSAVAQVCICGGMPEMRSMTLELRLRFLGFPYYYSPNRSDSDFAIGQGDNTSRPLSSQSFYTTKQTARITR